MKKILLGAMIASVALAASAAEVGSANVVGYTKIQLNEGYNMIGVQFSDIGGAEKSLTSVFTLDETFAGYDDDYKFSNKMRVWDGVKESYAFYGWAGSSGTDVDDDPTLDNTWTDMEAYAVEGEFFSVGSGAWIITDKSGTLTVSGEVKLEDVTIDLVAGYNIVCNPFPCEVSITDFGVLDSSFAGYDDDYKFSNKMRVWDGVKESYAFYGWAGSSGTDIDDDPSLDNTWTDMEAYAVDGKIKPGEAVWIITEKAGTMTFKAPKIK